MVGFEVPLAFRGLGCAGGKSSSSFPEFNIPNFPEGLFFFFNFVFPIQNSPELDEEGYSIRPEEPGYILWFWLCLLGYSLGQELGFTGRPLAPFISLLFIIHYYYSFPPLDFLLELALHR